MCVSRSCGDDQCYGEFGAKWKTESKTRVLTSRKAAVTKSVSFGITGSTSYIAPFILARTWATLDHITKGRVAWNVVTSFNTTAAQAMGLEDVKSSAERYEAAHEYMDLCYQ